MSFPTPPSTDLPLWAYGGSAVLTEPPTLQKQTGWVAVAGQTYGPIPPYQYENWMKFSAGQWIQFSSSALTYLSEWGISEWTSTISYSIGNLVQDGTGILYVSLINMNLNNALTSAVSWSTPKQNGVLTPNTLNRNLTVLTATTLTWPNLTISSPFTLTVNSGGYLNVKGSLITPSGATLIINGTCVISA